MSFSPGDVISEFHGGITQSFANRYTLQIASDKHITLLPELLQYINHSCNPNVFFDTTLMVLTTLKNIEPGDEFSFFYPSTEWDMAEPFKCNCGSSACLQYIKGASSLSVETLEKYRLTDFIRQMIRLKLSL